MIIDYINISLSEIKQFLYPYSLNTKKEYKIIFII